MVWLKKKIQIRALVKFKGERFQSTSLLWLLFEGSKVHFCVKPNSVELSWGCIEVELELWKNLITRQKFRGRRDQTMFYQSQNLSKLKEDLCFSLCSWSLHEHAREAFMSMLVKPSWACSWDSHEHLCSWKVHEHAHEAFTRTCAWSCHGQDHFIELCILRVGVGGRMGVGSRIKAKTQFS